ncbi:cytochrome c [uncultured Sulfitobacter sp.]|uniref:c-type cytochrome n=1 Tax=uncultured Sulfitobacter sp. TaxID=191468 RepID=UPI002607279A|nr:cytochrome c [uncultured Sulfitobacter sp.]
MRKIISLAAISLLIIGGWWIFLKPQDVAEQSNTTEGAAMVEVVLPASFTPQEQMGETAFNAKCAACHGINGAGQDGIAPPLIHKIYEPSHHGDMSFQLAAMNGVRAHHWPFGNMPAVEGVTPSDITNITAYVRAIQRANGIN